MLPEMRYIEGELIPMLRERAGKHEKKRVKAAAPVERRKGRLQPAFDWRAPEE